MLVEISIDYNCKIAEFEKCNEYNNEGIDLLMPLFIDQLYGFVEFSRSVKSLQHNRTTIL